MKLQRFIVLAAALILAISPHLHAQEPNPTRAACLSTAYASYAEAQKAYQHELHRMLMKRAPYLRSLAEVALEGQLSLSAARHRAFLATLRGNAYALRTGMTVNQWLDWGPAQQDSLRRQDPEYARQVAEAARLRAKAIADPNWSTLQRVLREDVLPSAEHASAVEVLRKAMDTASKTCE